MSFPRTSRPVSVSVCVCCTPLLPSQLHAARDSFPTQHEHPTRLLRMVNCLHGNVQQDIENSVGLRRHFQLMRRSHNIHGLSRYLLHNWPCFRETSPAPRPQFRSCHRWIPLLSRCQRTRSRTATIVQCREERCVAQNCLAHAPLHKCPRTATRKC